MLTRSRLAVAAALSLLLVCLAAGGVVFWLTKEGDAAPVIVAVSTSIPTDAPTATDTPAPKP